MNSAERVMSAYFFGAALLLLTACDSSGASPPSETSIRNKLAAEVCVKGEARDTVVYFRNLDGSEWYDIEFMVEKGGEVYTLGEEPQSMRPGSDRPTSWPPESVKTAQAFSDPGEFTRRTGATWRGQGGSKKVDRASSYQASMERLGSFSHLTSAIIKVGGQKPGEWSGDVVRCN